MTLTYFALLLYFYWREKLHSTMTMQSPIKGRSCTDTKETSRIHSDIVICTLSPSTPCPYWLRLSCSIIMELARQKQLKCQLGQSTVDLTDVVKHSTDFMAACYGCKAPCSSITECRQQLWAQKTEVNSSTKTVWFATNRWSIWAKCLQSTLAGCPVVQCPESSTSSQCCELRMGSRWSKQ